MKILIIGAGYAGRRHALNLKELKCDVSIYDTDPNVMAWAIENKFEWVEETYISPDGKKYDGAIISTPPDQHYKNIHRCYGDKIKFILCEKPLGLSWTETITPPLWSDGIMMAHNYLFEPELFKYKEGMIAWLRSNREWVYTSHDWMPEWRGIEFANNYKDWHEAKDGCMAVSVSHLIYILDYLFGKPFREEYYKANNILLDIEADNVVTGYRENATSRVMFVESWVTKGQRKHTLVDSATQVGFDWIGNPKVDTLQTYKTMLKCWLNVIEGKREIPELCSLGEGIRIVKCIEESKTLENSYV